MNITPIILSGGSGTRLWPLSRKDFPKQFLSFFKRQTLLQDTITRLQNMSNINDPIIICNKDHRFLVAEQCRAIGVTNPIILLEPCGRNTAPAIATGVLKAKEIFGDSVLLILTSDHMIKNLKEFLKVIKISIKEALKEKLITFGIKPTHPNTNFGYIKTKNNSQISNVEKFIEKPDLKTAKSFVKNGNYLWNSGMFLFKTSTIINELNNHTPYIISKVKQSIEDAKYDKDFVFLDEDSFKAIPSISIDYALMEKSEKISVVTLNAGWSDLGSWSTIYDISPKDDNGNVLQGNVITQQTKNTFIYSPNHITATIGLKDLIIVNTKDATLIASYDQSHYIKSIIQKLEKQKRYEINSNLKVFRPWGWFEIIESGLYYQVKKLHVKPYAKLSLQMHHKRSEHWVIVNGEATVTNGNKNFKLTKGQSTFIPLGTKHSLENKKEQKLEIIEIQSGEYLGEDDIVRYEDLYGRI